MSENAPVRSERVLVKPRNEAAPPRRFKVLLHNDDYTTMEFVVLVLQAIFRKHHDEAVGIMLNVHRGGVGIAGVYPAQIAETKIQAVRGMARQEGYPLLCTMEPE
jgi:ATP-dependent Clp protease adaptor protein ClpS